MSELPLSEQDADLLIKALESLQQSVEGTETFAALQSSIQFLLKQLKELHGEERLQALAAIYKTLSELRLIWNPATLAQMRLVKIKGDRRKLDRRLGDERGILSLYLYGSSAAVIR